MRIYSGIILLTSVFSSCSEQRSDDHLESIITSNDTVYKDDGQLVVCDPLFQIDNAVEELDEQIRNNQLTKKELNRKSVSGGYVFEFVDTSNVIKYFYSRSSGEIGTTETKCYYKNGLPVFLIYSNYAYDLGTEYESQLDESHMVYCLETYIIEDKLDHKIIKPLVKNDVFQNSDIPNDHELLQIIENIETDLKKWIK